MSSSPQIVLDASAIIAYLDGEKGSEVVEQWLPGSAVSMVNICEVISVLVRQGKSEENVSTEIRTLIPMIIPFGWDVARMAAAMITTTQSKGLKLGDRAAFATAKLLNIPLLTAESRWLEVPAEVDIRLIREGG